MYKASLSEKEQWVSGISESKMEWSVANAYQNARLFIFLKHFFEKSQEKIQLQFQTYVFFIARNRIEIIQSLEGRFEESVIAYLFLLNTLPILIIPMTWIETRKFTDVLNNWTEFEVKWLALTSQRVYFQCYIEKCLPTLTLTVALKVFVVS